MCFDTDSRPPIAPIAGAAVDGRRIEVVSEDRTSFMAYSASAGEPSAPGMLILPDVRGLHRFYEELALRFAEAGIDALAIDYFGRTTRSSERGGDFDHQSHVAQVTYAGLLDDVSAGVRHLRSEGASRAVFAVGFCFGGRLALVTAARPELELSGVIGFYGSPSGPSSAGVPAPADEAADMLCPVLALFGGADRGIPPDAVELFRRRLGEAGVEHEVVVYPGAPHSFFDRKAAEYAEASDDAWRRVREFVGHHAPPAADQRAA